ncbi:MAG: hypothetical protein KF893_18135 [Caldilineaceae bacterium]|nr:hypothetical protein [Caldilineaceae bacterium]
MKQYLAPLSAVFSILVLGAVIAGAFFLNGSTPEEVLILRSASEAQATGPLNGGFAGAISLEASHQGIFSDTVQTTLQELGEIDLGLLLTQVGSTVTGYVDLTNTLIVTGEHTIQATPIAPTPLPGTPALQPVSLAVGPSVSGSFDGTTFLLTSERTTGSAAGREISRQFQMTGTLETGATFLALRGVYRETLWDYSPQPLTVVGHFELIQPIFVSAQVETPTPTSTSTPTDTPGAMTSTATATATATTVPANTATPTPTAVSANTATPTATATTVPANTATPTPTAVSANTATPTATATTMPVNTATATATATTVPANTATPTATATTMPVNTATPTATSTTVPANTATPTATSTTVPANTATPAPTATSTTVPANTATPTATSTTVPANTATPTPTATSTTVPANTATPTATVTATATPTPTATTIPNGGYVIYLPSVMK